MFCLIVLTYAPRAHPILINNHIILQSSGYFNMVMTFFNHSSWHIFKTVIQKDV